MATCKSWIKAARPRTLPLAVSGIIMGAGLAWYYGHINMTVSLLAFFTAAMIQVFSNLANDFGDGQKGTDNEFRLGPMRTIQSGEISPGEMRMGLLVTGGISFLSGLLLLYLAIWDRSKTGFFTFIGLGILALLAAYFYTAGKKSYGYIGLGDLAVFLFFGPLPVLGVFYLNTLSLNQDILLPAISLGLFSTGVLNINNMRDIDNDALSGKNTLPVIMGEKGSKIYHSFLILGGMSCSIAFTILVHGSAWSYLYVLSFPFFLYDLVRIFRTTEAADLDPYLKRLALSTMLFTLLFCAGNLIAIS